MVRTSRSIKLGLIIGMFTSGVYADQISNYSIHFAGGNLEPTSGSFSLDATTDQFLSFTVNWDGLTYDFLNSLATKANLFSFGSCPKLSASIIVSYFVGQGTCTSPAVVSWDGDWQSAAFEGFNFVLSNSQDNGMTFTNGFGFTALSSSGTPLVVDDTVGIATASLATPEPSYFVVLTLLFGALLVPVRISSAIRNGTFKLQARPCR
jgi:hypothetical protein